MLFRGFSAKILVKKPGSSDELDSWREVLRPKRGAQDDRLYGARLSANVLKISGEPYQMQCGASHPTS